MKRFIPLLLGASILPVQAGLNEVRGAWDLDSTFDGYWTGFPAIDASTLAPGADYSFGSAGGYTFLQTQVFATSAKRLTVANPIGTNGGTGATRTNRWTVVMDVRFDSLSPYAGFLQLDPANSADVTFFVNSAGAVLSSAGQISTLGAITANTWYRLAITCGNDGAGGTPTVKFYLNGAPNGTPKTSVFDGPLGMRSTFLLFSDNNAEVRPSKLGSLAVWGEELSAADIATLGGPQPTGILGAGKINPLFPPLTAGTISPAAPYAYGANVGWVHARPSAAWGMVVGDTSCSGFAYGANIGWINFGDASPANGIRYANTDGADFGVNHDGLGNLSGLAWGANIGWINFGANATGSPRPVSDPVRPRFNLTTGQFSGYAWGANIGWIDLATLSTATIASPDTDGDGLADAWEREHFTYLAVSNGVVDTDRDGISDKNEYLADTNPLDPQSRLRIVDHLVQFFPLSGYNTWDVTFTSSPKRLYRVETSFDLGATPWVNGSSWSPGAAGATTFTTIAVQPGPRNFLRVRTMKPLQP